MCAIDSGTWSKVGVNGVECEPITGSRGVSPRWVQGQSPSEGQRTNTREAKIFLGVNEGTKVVIYSQCFTSFSIMSINLVKKKGHVHFGVFLSKHGDIYIDCLDRK